MEKRSSIDDMINSVPKRLVKLGYLITTLVMVVFFVFFIYINIPQNLEKTINLKYSENKLEGSFTILEKYSKRFTSDSLNIYINNDLQIGVIKQSVLTGKNIRTIYFDVVSIDGDSISNYINSNDSIFSRAYVKITIKSSFLEKMINR